MTTLLLVSHDRPDTAQLAALDTRGASVSMSEPESVDADLADALGRLRGVSSRQRRWLQGVEWHVEVEIDATDELLDALRADVDAAAIARGFAVVDLRDRTISFPAEAEVDDDGADPGPVWEHLPISDVSVPRADVSLGEGFAIADALVVPSASSDATEPLTESRLSVALTRRRPPYVVFVGVYALSVAPELLLAEALRSIHIGGPMDRALHLVAAGSLRTLMSGMALVASALLVRGRWPRRGVDACATTVATCALGAVGIAAGSLLIIPGILLWVRWALAPIVALHEDVSAPVALRRSSTLVHGAGRSLFGLACCVVLVTEITTAGMARFHWYGGYTSPSLAGNVASIGIRAMLAPLVILWLIQLHEDRTGVSSADAALT